MTSGIPRRFLVRCDSCGVERQTTAVPGPCPACGSNDHDLLATNARRLLVPTPGLIDEPEDSEVRR